MMLALTGCQAELKEIPMCSVDGAEISLPCTSSDITSLGYTVTMDNAEELYAYYTDVDGNVLAVGYREDGSIIDIAADTLLSETTNLSVAGIDFTSTQAEVEEVFGTSNIQGVYVRNVDNYTLVSCVSESGTVERIEILWED